MERHAVMPKPADPGDGLVEGAATGAGHPIDVVQPLGAVHADPDIDLLFSEERAPRVVDQRPVGLEGVRQAQPCRLQPVDQPERPSIKIDRQHHRFAGVPDDSQTVLRQPDAKTCENKFASVCSATTALLLRCGR
jgi:hypothetical protein